MIDIRKNCKYRHDNGNCLKVGGFCLAVDDEHCERALAIEALKEQKWIPVSERLPDIDINNPDQSVLISCWSRADNYFVQEALVCRDSYGEIYFDSLYCKEKVLAWQPLPEPYKAGEQE